MTTRHHPGTPEAITASGASGRPPGHWPGTPYSDALYLQFQRERARRVLVLGSIRASLTEQPNAACTRTCARRWVADILGIAEDVVTNKTEST